MTIYDDTIIVSFDVKSLFSNVQRLGLSRFPVKGVSECNGQILGRAYIRTAFRTVTTIRSLLVKTKPATEKHYKKGVIYKVSCQDCTKVYIGKTGRKLVSRLNEHKQHCRLLQADESTIAEYAIGENHHIDFDQSKVLTTEDRFWPKKIKEALLIKDTLTSTRTQDLL